MDISGGLLRNLTWKAENKKGGAVTARVHGVSLQLLKKNYLNKRF